MRISVIGGRRASDEEREVATEVGRSAAQRGHVVVCGGLTGVMEAACEGAQAADGETIGILPGADRSAANPFVDTAIATDMGNARNVLVALNGDAVIAVGGSAGTLSEIGHALDFERPTVGLGTHDLPEIEFMETAEEAVKYVEQATNSE